MAILHVAYLVIVLEIFSLRPPTFLFLCLLSMRVADLFFYYSFRCLYTLSERKENLSLRSHVNGKFNLRVGGIELELCISHC